MQNLVATLEDGIGGDIRLLVHGRVDSRRAPDFHRAVSEASARPNVDLTLDLRHAEFIGIAAFQIILSLREALRASGRRLRFEHVSEDVASVAKLCGLHEALSDL